MITVTMPIKEYEHMKKDIERLKKESIYMYAKREYSDFNRNEYEITIDLSAMMKAISEEEHKPVTFKTI
ncbi:hypothetical protein SAMN05216389_1447 [Oceanobacillus limi]|uniref:Uncharacterized protein n=1 Tax=Oceanobacillus limi TaxID=930131 RepID=A0A1I0HPJ9_9BACI|nr:hypothetical protein [Oceanobacillus limi]SET85915.1 hypothetical protein SAMN05216389_1447 [Oceanobacillus limi]